MSDSTLALELRAINHRIYVNKRKATLKLEEAVREVLREYTHNTGLHITAIDVALIAHNDVRSGQVSETVLSDIHLTTTKGE